MKPARSSRGLGAKLSLRRTGERAVDNGERSPPWTGFLLSAWGGGALHGRLAWWQGSVHARPGSSRVVSRRGLVRVAIISWKVACNRPKVSARFIRLEPRVWCAHPWRGVACPTGLGGSSGASNAVDEACLCWGSWWRHGRDVACHASPAMSLPEPFLRAVFSLGRVFRAVLRSVGEAWHAGCSRRGEFAASIPA